MEKSEIVATLRKTDPFELLEDGVLEELAEKVTIRHYRPNTYVFRQGDVSLDALFIIVAGLVEITARSDRGVESVIAVRRPHDFFSETVVLSQQRYPASARVKEALTCCLVNRRDLERLIYSYTEFSGFFNTLLAERIACSIPGLQASSPTKPAERANPRCSASGSAR